MIGQEPWPLTRDEFYMNPSSTADQATAKLIAVKRTLPLDRLVKRNSKPIPPLLPQSFCPSSPPPPPPRCASILFPRPWVPSRQATRNPSDTLEAAQSLAATKGANKRISKLPSGKEVPAGGLPSGQSNPRFRSPALVSSRCRLDKRMVNSNPLPRPGPDIDLTWLRYRLYAR